MRLNKYNDVIRFLLNLRWEFDVVNQQYLAEIPRDVRFPDGTTLSEHLILYYEKPLPCEIEKLPFVHENLNETNIDDHVKSILSTAVIKFDDGNRRIRCFRKAFQDQNGIVWQYLGNGSFNAVYRTELKSPLQVGSVMYPVGAHLVFRLYSARFSVKKLNSDLLCEPQRAVRLLNDVEAAFHDNSNRLFASDYLDGLIAPFIGSAKIESSELHRHILQLYLKTGRIILDGSVCGNLLQGPHFPDLDFAIRRGSQASMTFWLADRNRKSYSAWFNEALQHDGRAPAVHMVKALLYLEWHEAISNRQIAAELENNTKAVCMLSMAYDACASYSLKLEVNTRLDQELNLGSVLCRARTDIGKNLGVNGVRLLALLDAGASIALCYKIQKVADTLGDSADIFFTQDQVQLAGLLRYLNNLRVDFESIVKVLLTLPHQQNKLFLALRKAASHAGYSFDAVKILRLVNESIKCDPQAVEYAMMSEKNCFRLIVLRENHFHPHIAFACISIVECYAYLHLKFSLRDKTTILAQLVYKTHNKEILESIIASMHNALIQFEIYPEEHGISSEFINQIKIAHRDAMTKLKNLTEPNRRNMPSLFSSASRVAARLNEALVGLGDRKYLPSMSM